MLSTKTILGAGWSVSARLGGRAIDFVTVLVLARTLTPADFGLTALAMTLIAIVDTVLEIPLLQALTRLKCVEKSHLDTAFTLGVLRGLLVSLVVLAAAWPFSIIFHDSSGRRFPAYHPSRIRQPQDMADRHPSWGQRSIYKPISTSSRSASTGASTRSTPSVPCSERRAARKREPLPSFILAIGRTQWVSALTG
jgi:hypothetical protein